MPDDQERSPSGQPIYRYNKPPREFAPPDVYADYCQQITDHVERHVGTVNTVLHEIISHLVHIDVLLVEPTDEMPLYTLVTSGMSDKPMKTPEGAEECCYAELAIRLPGAWPIKSQEERDYWPIRLLKFLARFPHEYDSWLWWGHTMPNGDPPEPWAPDTKLCGMILLPSITLPEEFQALTVHDNKQIHFFSVYPLYQEEMDFKLKKGADALIDKFAEAGVSDVLDTARPNTCGKRGWRPF